VSAPRPRDPDRRIVITGTGIISTIGESPETFHAALVAGRSGISRWKTARDPAQYSRIGGDLSDFDLDAHLGARAAAYPAELRKLCLSLMRSAPLVPRLVAAAALQAWHDARIAGAVDPERFGHVLGGHNLNTGYLIDNARTFERDDPDYIEPLFGLLSLDTDVLAATCQLLGLRGPSYTVGGACASGNLAILAAMETLRAGRADAMLVTGAPIQLHPLAVHGWALLDAISIRSFNDEPERASRPFDAEREGFVPSEACGVLVLETLACARARGARTHAELLGAAATSDASRLTRPDVDGQHAAMRLALADAGVGATDVDYINAHATSTPLGDAVEVAAIEAALGGHARRIPVNSTKSMIGHCLSAAGVVELIATVLQMRHGVVHPTINQEKPDPDLHLDFVPNHAREARIDIALSNSFGFGGLNACVVIGQPEA
jgi:3-oxoacyl-(acyl-carrier-protein) synthase